MTAPVLSPSPSRHGGGEPISSGFAPGRGFARRELAEHRRALCLALHGRRDGDCPLCAEVLRRAS
jgi:hypothetical protein